MAIKPIDHYSLTTPGTVYDEEALTALELASRTAAKVNESITAYNVLESETHTHLAEQDAEISERLSAQDAAIPVKVNAGINANIDNGTFDSAINRYAGDLEARLDHLTENLPDGSTNMDAEIVDARLSSEDNAYPTLRAAITGQIKHAINGTTLIDDINRFNPATITTNVYVDPTTGVLTNNTKYCTSDFIPVKPGETIHFNHDLYPFAIRYAVFFSETEDVLSFVETVNTLVVPAGAAYMRISFDATVNPGSIMVSRPYYGYKHVPYGEHFNYTVPDVNIYRVAFTNRYDSTKAITNAYVDGTNGRTSLPEGDTDYVCSDFIPILPGETLKLCYPGIEANANIRFCAAYDENFNYVGGLENVKGVSQGDNIKYVRFTINAVYKDTAMVCGTDQIEHLNYGEFVIKPTASAADTQYDKQLNSILGGGCVRTSGVNLSANGTIGLSEFPRFIKKNLSYTFYGLFNDTEFVKLTIGSGKQENTYDSMWFEITPNTIDVKRWYTDHSETISHAEFDMSIEKFIHVVVTCDNEGVCTITLTTLSGTFTHNFNCEYKMAGYLFVTPGQYINYYQFSAACSDFSKPLWIVGDSYLGFTDNRVMGQMKKLGFTNFLCLAQAGLDSGMAFGDLTYALEFGTPKYLIWYMGMNDGATATNYTPYVAQLREICESRGITLILNVVPTVPGITKEAIRNAINSTGCRTINSYHAVGTNANGEWYEGMLDYDNVHPTEFGAQTLAIQMLHDVPEIMTYGRGM